MHQAEHSESVLVTGFLCLNTAGIRLFHPSPVHLSYGEAWDFKEQAADALKLTASDLLEHKIIDRIIPEPEGGAHRDHKEAANILKKAILEELKPLEKIDGSKFLDMRIKKYGAMGYWEG